MSVKLELESSASVKQILSDLLMDKQFFPGTFTFLIPVSKLYKMLLVVLLLDSSKVCPAPTRLRWATILP